MVGLNLFVLRRTELPLNLCLAKITGMLHLVTAVFLWLMMMNVSVCDPLEGFDSSYLFDKSVLDEDPQDIYNKTLASKSSTTRNDGRLRPSSPPLPPAMIPLPSTPKYPAPPILDGVDVASHSSTNRGFFTPPLPKNQFSFPFADKPTLRGSNLDSAPSNKRLLPPSIVSRPVDKERIPIIRPDLILPSDTKKKTINTPTFQKFPEGLNYSEPSTSPSSTTNRVNDTFEVVVPVVHNISHTNVLRLLNNGNKHDYFGNNKSPFSGTDLKTPSKAYKEDVIKNFSMAPPTSSSSLSHSSPIQSSLAQSPSLVQPPALAPMPIPQSSLPPYHTYSSSNSDVYNPYENHHKVIVKEPQVTEGGRHNSSPAFRSVPELRQRMVNSMPNHVEPRVRHILGIAWDIHVYLMAVLFAVLACVSVFSLLRVRSYKWLLPYSHFFAVHTLLMTIGAMRSFYLFYDAYNIGKSFSKPVNRLMLNIIFPFLVCVFSLMFVFVLKIVDLKANVQYSNRKTNTILLLVATYLLLSIGIDLYADLTPYAGSLELMSQCLFVLLCIVLGLAYVAFYKHANWSSLRKQNPIYGTAFTDQLRPSLAHAIRVMLATSLLSLLMATVQLIGMFCIYNPFNKDQPHPWLWWAFQLSVRVIEVSICFLVFWAAVQPLRDKDEKETQSHNSTSGFPLFPWGATGTASRSSNHDRGDDFYPTMCPTSQVIHNYSSLRHHSHAPSSSNFVQLSSETHFEPQDETKIYAGHPFETVYGNVK